MRISRNQLVNVVGALLLPMISEFENDFDHRLYEKFLEIVDYHKNFVRVVSEIRELI